MIISNQQTKITFKVWPKGFRKDLFFKNYFTFSPDSFPIFSSYFYKPSNSGRFRFRSVAVRSCQYGYISDRSIEAFRKIVTPYFRKKGYHRNAFFIHIYPFMPLTKKPAEVRMGGGKGSKMRGLVSPVRPGQILFSIFSFNPLFSKKLLTYASRKLSVKSSVFYI